MHKVTAKQQSEETAKILKKLGMPDVQSVVHASECLGKAMNGIAKRLLKLNTMKETLTGGTANDLIKKSGPYIMMRHCNHLL